MHFFTSTNDAPTARKAAIGGACKMRLASGCEILAIHARAQRVRIAPIQGLRCYNTHTHKEASIELAAHATYNSRAPQMESTLDHPTKA